MAVYPYYDGSSTANHWAQDPSATPLGSDSSTGYIPEIWSGKLLEKFYLTTVMGEISNTEYEGEITAYGDKIKIRTTPDITIRDYEIGQDLTYERPTSAKVEMVIDKGKYYAYSVNSVEQKQADIDYVNKWSDDGAQQMKIKVDLEVLGMFEKQADGSTEIVGTNATTKTIGDVATTNQGVAAGAISGSVNLGVLTTTAAETASTCINLNASAGLVVDKLVEMGQVLDEANVPESDRWCVLPAWAIALIKKSDLKDASITGDSVSILRNGKVGMIDRFTLYMSNQLPTVTDGGATGDPTITMIPFGHKSALSFASQMTENEVIDNPSDFGQLVRGLQVYGRKILQTSNIGVLQGYKA